MSNDRRFRLWSVLRVARGTERDAQRNAADASSRADEAALEAEAERSRLAELDGTAIASVADFQAHRTRAELRAKSVASSEQRRADLLAEEWQAHTELLAAVRRRRSLENFEERHLAAQAVLAATAAQKALDELASARRGARP